MEKLLPLGAADFRDIAGAENEKAVFFFERLIHG